MCGIAGCVVAAGARPDEEALRRMSAALRHRGPDDDGVAVVGGVGLVHRRLAIVDPSPAGHCPMEHPDGRWWLTYNGEVFNHLELRRSLPAVRWRGGSDTETLLHALAAWDVAAVERCNGLFAYAALDRERRRLLLVRDRFGVKPLYVARHAGALWFASEIGALLAAGVPRRARADVLATAVARGWAGGTVTPVEGVARVAPGTLLSVDLDSLEVSERAWYDPARAVDPERLRAFARSDRAGAAAGVEEALRESVRRRLMADVPVGTMCSGGIDSGLVTAFARDEHPRIAAFNASVSDQPEWDEGPWAEKVARHLGVELHTVRMTAASWRAGLVEAVRHVEYPLTHESSVPMAQIAALARAEGMKVLLSGEGADELFGGYSWLHLRDFADFSRRRRPAERAARIAYRRLRPAAEEPSGVPELDRFEAALGERALAAYSAHRGPRRRLEAGLLSDLGTYLPHLLNRQDKTTMQHSIETRVPFLDPDVVSLALNLPLEVRVEPERKGVLRDLAARHLPDGVATRPKVGFGFDAERYIVDAARPEFLSDGRLREVLGVGRDAWRRRVAATGGYFAMVLWTGEIWCRTVLDGRPAGEVEEALWA